MQEYDVKLTIQKVLEKYPNVGPRIISDNGSQFISRDFAEFIKHTELDHIRTSVNYPLRVMEKLNAFTELSQRSA